MNSGEERDAPKEDPLSFAMDRVAIWKAAYGCLHSVGWQAGSEYTVSDVLLLAKFLAGDDIPADAMMDMIRDPDTDT